MSYGRCEESMVLWRVQRLEEDRSCAKCHCLLLVFLRRTGFTPAFEPPKPCSHLPWLSTVLPNDAVPSTVAECGSSLGTWDGS
ncbi:uncharacterized protein LOC143441293 isoform X2 [Arvicanthis niloticus]|uniref:uncharacterized protein LOC143311511 isoform X2 n=1 Tax=Arvicanthis niloticus TaxID=61156 RepID=UPI00402B3CB1